MNTTRATARTAMFSLADISLTRILCPIGFGADPQRVAGPAAVLARLHNAELRLFHVVTEFDCPREESLADAGFDEAADWALSRLFVVTRRFTECLRVSGAVSRGNVVEEIVCHARLVRPDVVVVGSSGLGRTTESLIERLALEARCPVLVVPTTNESLPMTTPDGHRSMRKLVCAVDFQTPSLTAAGYALALGRRAGAPVAVLHVVPDGCDESTQPENGLSSDLLEDQFGRLLRTALRDAGLSRREARAVVVSGSPAAEIIRFAHVAASDLIVIGVDAADNSTRKFDGTAASVVQFAPCPVLLVPAQPRYRPTAPSNERHA